MGFAVNRFGPDTYEVNALIPGDVLVEPDGVTGKVKIGTADSTAILGVTLYAAAPQGAIEGTTDYGAVSIDMSTLQTEVAVAWQGTYKLKATGAIAFGALVECAANGTVKTADAPAHGTVVGKCVAPAGIVSGEFGLIRLNLG